MQKSGTIFLSASMQTSWSQQSLIDSLEYANRMRVKIRKAFTQPESQ